MLSEEIVKNKQQQQQQQQQNINKTEQKTAVWFSCVYCICLKCGGDCDYCCRLPYMGISTLFKDIPLLALVFHSALDQFANFLIQW